VIDCAVKVAKILTGELPEDIDPKWAKQHRRSDPQPTQAVGEGANRPRKRGLTPRHK
jgi:hypothetical protein